MLPSTAIGRHSVMTARVGGPTRGDDLGPVGPAVGRGRPCRAASTTDRQAASAAVATAVRIATVRRVRWVGDRPARRAHQAPRSASRLAVVGGGGLGGRAAAARAPAPGRRRRGRGSGRARRRGRRRRWAGRRGASGTATTRTATAAGRAPPARLGLGSARRGRVRAAGGGRRRRLGPGRSRRGGGPRRRAPASSIRRRSRALDQPGPDDVDRLVEEDAGIAAALFERVEQRDPGRGVAGDQGGDERIDGFGVGQPEQVADAGLVDRSPAPRRAAGRASTRRRACRRPRAGRSGGSRRDRPTARRPRGCGRACPRSRWSSGAGRRSAGGATGSPAGTSTARSRRT